MTLICISPSSLFSSFVLTFRLQPFLSPMGTCHPLALWLCYSFLFISCAHFLPCPPAIRTTSDLHKPSALLPSSPFLVVNGQNPSLASVGLSIFPTLLSAQMKVAGLSLNPWPSTSSQPWTLLGNSNCIHSTIADPFILPLPWSVSALLLSWNPPPFTTIPTLTSLSLSARKHTRSEDSASTPCHHADLLSTHTSSSFLLPGLGQL